jgi:hypothetical protein
MTGIKKRPQKEAKNRLIRIGTKLRINGDFPAEKK